MATRFDRFSDDARLVLQQAQEEAQRLRHNYIGTEHLLLGLVRQSGEIVQRMLSTLGVDLETVRSAVAQATGGTERNPHPDIGLTPGAKKAIELSVEECRRRDDESITAEHILVAVLNEGGTAVAILHSLGVNPEDLRSQAEERLAAALGRISRDHGSASRRI